MKARPSHHELELPARESAGWDLERFDVDRDVILGVHSMEVRPAHMSPFAVEHEDHDPVEAADLGHGRDRTVRQ
jgi:hypothetical protein